MGQVHEIERNADFPGNHLSYESVLFPFAVSVESSFGVVPVLHKHSKDIVALLLEQQGCDTGVYSS